MSRKKTVRKASPPRILSSAECARRTGVTIRALRVYERAGLIKPQRSANGWRVYGESEVRRLNEIMTLKTLGLTLREIRDVLSESSSPSLSGVLQLQLKTWLARQGEAERALKLVRAALARLAAEETLSVEEICELARSTEMSHSMKVLRELVSQEINPDEQLEYINWWSQRPAAEARAMQAFSEAQRPLFASLERLRLKGAAADSSEVQALIEQHQEIMLTYGVRATIVDLMEWNPALTRKWMTVGERYRDLSQGGEPMSSSTANPVFYRFFIDAVRASEMARTIRPIIDESQSLIHRKLAPTSDEAQDLARRLEQACRRFRLGDPVVYALSTAFIVKVERNGQWFELDESQQVPYRFLAEAVRSAAQRRGVKSG